MHKKLNQVKIELGKPAVVAQASPEVRQWGEFQFPVIERLPDNRLHIAYAPGGFRDNAAYYGKSLAHAVSADNGLSWTQCEAAAITGDKRVSTMGLALPNGEYIFPAYRPSIKVTEKIRRILPRPLPGHPGVFKAEDFPGELTEYRLFRRPKGKTEWKKEKAEVHLPGAIRTVIASNIEVNIDGQVCSLANGCLPFPMIGWGSRGIITSDGGILFGNYSKRLVEGRLREDYACVFLSSSDDGHTWELLSEIPYEPDRRHDPTWKEREALGWHEGFNEPDITVL
ncbi:MAG: sialidase family protein, partial [Victivallales bacterium]